MDDILKDFLAETSDQIDAVGAQLVQFEQDPGDARIIASIFRLVHTIKGTCGFLGLPRLASVAHSAETLLGRLRDGASPTHERVSLILSAIDRIRLILTDLEKSAIEPEGSDADIISAIEQEVGDEGAQIPAEVDPMQLSIPAEPEVVDHASPDASADGMSPDPGNQAARAAASNAPGPATIRVAVGALERIMALVSELVLTRNQLLEITRHSNDEGLKNPLQHLSSLTTDLQDSVMRARMQPIGRLFSNLPRLVRELAADLDKKMILVAEGSDTELDRQLIELIRDPLTHMVRNCADHGIETPTERLAAGKPEIGMIRLRASHETGHITIEIADDGRGLDVDRIRAKALSLGLATADELSRMSNDLVCRFIFAAGFSTAAQVTSVSGRGVGMDVVRENIESIGGTISLSTTVGRGTIFSLKIPLTLAIAPALIIESRGLRFALPQHAVVEAVGVTDDDSARVDNVQGALVLRLRDQVLPIADLGRFLGVETPVGAPGVDQLVVVMRVGSLNFGVIVDSVCDVQEIVVKPLGQSLSGLMPFSGNTILGDGSVVLILDPPGLAKSLGLDNSSEFSVAPSQPPFVMPREPMRLIVFRAGDGALKAAPLSIISRIESVRSEDIFVSDGMRVMTHQGRLMPLISPSENIVATMPGGVQPVLVIGVGGEPMGLLVSEIIDIIEEQLEIEIAGETPGVIGSTTIKGQPTEILDITHFMRLARPGAFSRGHTRRFAVLIVDDKLFFRDMLAPIVSAAGYEVSTAGSGEEALELFEKGAQFDVVVTDTDMPDMDGYSFARTLLADPRRVNLPVIAMAAHAAPAVLDAARTAGMRAAVGKFDRGALLAALTSALDGGAFNFHALESSVISKVAA